MDRSDLKKDAPCGVCGADTMSITTVRGLQRRACPNGHQTDWTEHENGFVCVRKALTPEEMRRYPDDTCYFAGCEFPRTLNGRKLDEPYCYAHAKHVERYGAPRPVRYRRVSLEDAWADFRRRRGLDGEG